MTSFAALLLLLAPVIVGAEEIAPTPGIVYSPHRAFRIPLELTPEERSQTKAVRLFVSENHGQTWMQHADGPAGADVITFRAKRDGEFWFTIALVDAEGRQNPSDIQATEPGLKVVVDTTKPILDLRAIRSPSGRRGVRWMVDDPNVDIGSVRLAVWHSAAQSWQPYDVRRPEKNMVWFQEGENFTKFQASVFDLAANETVVEVEVVGSDFSKKDLRSFVLDDMGISPVPSGPAEPNPQPTVVPAGHVDTSPAMEQTTMCGSHQIVVNYVVDDDNPAAAVELWASRDDGAQWTLASVDRDGKSPIEASLEGDGRWGLRIVVPDAGAPSRPPAPGSEPEMYIEVDTIAPEVRIRRATLAGGRLQVEWHAMDKNLSPQAIDILIAPSIEGPWKSLSTALANTGSYVQTMPQPAPTGPCFVRVLARDKAGNAGFAQMPVQAGK